MATSLNELKYLMFDIFFPHLPAQKLYRVPEGIFFGDKYQAYHRLGFSKQKLFPDQRANFWIAKVQNLTICTHKTANKKISHTGDTESLDQCGS